MYSNKNYAKIGYFDWSSQSRNDRYKQKRYSQTQKLVLNYSNSPIANNKINKKLSQGRENLSKNLSWKYPELLLYTTGVIDSLQLIVQSIIQNGPIHCGLYDDEFPDTENYMRLVSKDVFKISRGINPNIVDHRNMNNAVIFVLSHVDFLSGHINDISTTTKILRDIYPNCTIVIDGSQAVGQISINPDFFDFDYYIFNCNKWLNGPKLGVILCENLDQLEKLIPFCPSQLSLSHKFEVNKNSSSRLDLTEAAMVPSLISSTSFTYENQNISFFYDQLPIELKQQIIRPIGFVGETSIVTFDMSKYTTIELKHFWDYSRQKDLFFSFIKLKMGLYYRFSIHELNKKVEILNLTKFLSKEIERKWN